MKAVTDFLFLGSKITVGGHRSHEIETVTSWQESYDKPRQHIRKQRHHFANKDLYCQSYGFSSGHVWMCKLDHKEGRAPKNWCFVTVVLEKTLESPLESKETKPVVLKGNQPWILFGRPDAEAPILWPPDEEGRFIGKDPNAGKDWGQEEKEATEDEMVGWHHWLNGQELEQTPGDRKVKDRKAWLAEVHGVAKSYILLRVWTITTTDTFY